MSQSTIPSVKQVVALVWACMAAKITDIYWFFHGQKQKNAYRGIKEHFAYLHLVSEPSEWHFSIRQHSNSKRTAKAAKG